MIYPHALYRRPVICHCLAACILLLPGAIASGQESGDFSSSLDVTVVTLSIDVRDAEGNVPGGLTVGDFELREDDTPREILAVERLASRRPALGESGPWQIAIYLDQVLAGRQGSKAAALGLAAQAQELTRLGEVQIVAAESTVEEVLPPTSDPAVLKAALERVAKKKRGREELVNLRRQFRRDITETGLQDQLTLSEAPGGPGAQRLVDRSQDQNARKRMLIRAGISQEAQVVERQCRQIMSWAKRERRLGPRVLLLVHDGFDPDPREFYLSGAPPAIESELNAELEGLNFGPLHRGMTRLLSAQGWIVVPIATGGLGSGAASQASEHGPQSATQQGLGIARNPSTSLFSRALGPLRGLAEESGGELVTDDGAIAMAVGELGDRFELSYQVPRPPDGQIHAIEVTAKQPGLALRYPRWIAAETLEEVALERAHQLANGDGESGEMPIAALVLMKPGAAPAGKLKGTLGVRLSLSPLARFRSALKSAAVRMTMVFYFRDKPHFARHEVLTEQDLSVGDEWKYSATMDLPQDVAKVVVVAEELATGMWGGAVAPMAQKKGTALPAGEKSVESPASSGDVAPVAPRRGARR